eukprot:5095217-Pyramimonas_sp.AAC.1
MAAARLEVGGWRTEASGERKRIAWRRRNVPSVSLRGQGGREAFTPSRQLVPQAEKEWRRGSAAEKLTRSGVHTSCVRLDARQTAGRVRSTQADIGDV